MNSFTQYKNSISNENLKISDIKLNDDEVRLTIIDLPNEIVLKIFSYLKPTCLLHKVSLVCKTWKGLAEDSSLWKTLYLTRRKRKINLFKYKFVQDLSIINFRIEDRFVKALSQLSALRSLYLHSCTIPDLQIKDRSWKLSLTSLKFSNTDNPDRLFNITNLKILKCLEISYCMLYEKESIIQNLQRCSHLETLGFVCVEHMFDFFMDEIVDPIIKSLDTLVNLSVYWFTTKGAFLNLSNCLKISKLYINCIGKLNDSILFQIMNFSRLKELHLHSCNDMTSEGIKRLFTEGQMGNLITLDLGYCKALSDSNLITIANCCKKLSFLKITHSTKATDDGMSVVVNTCSEIVDLGLIAFSKLKGSFLLNIKENLLMDLMKVDLTSSSLKKKYVDAFRAARPEVQIIYSHDMKPLLALRCRLSNED